jgi:hypothetical protein
MGEGEIPRRTGYPSPATIQGFNMPNRVVLSNAVKAGDRFQIAVFAMNRPISMPPPNSVWFRQALMEFYVDKAELRRQWPGPTPFDRGPAL